ncbi:MAG TPA: ATP-binding SpoIIE family protein phosphatase [Candidatus Aquilonibacter sp.]|jgi:anti-sigma regulatory factor (Ser/Thr protein kinase)|nr:ATP-binding SpoIIE family protein phosphatase [Candidatus Aquilonibacter sp.]
MLIQVSEASQTGEVRRKAMAFAEALEMDESRRGRVALAATEMATNLVKHAGSGHILVQRLQENGNSGLRIMSVDKGPGIADISRALSDGHSTAGSMGTGLGAVQRLSDSFKIYTNPGSGTVVSAEFWLRTHTRSIHGPLQIAVISEPIPGEEECGDGWGVRLTADTTILMVVDGLGHGILAAEAAREAERILAEARKDSLPEILLDTHDALRKTRGAAFALVKIDMEKSLLAFTGVGNISASIVAPGSSRSMASHNGIVGQQMKQSQEFSYPWNKDNVLVMHSDGLATRWDLDRYPGIWNKPPCMIAAILHRDFNRGRDDVTVLVAKAAEAKF